MLFDGSREEVEEEEGGGGCGVNVDEGKRGLDVSLELKKELL